MTDAGSFAQNTVFVLEVCCYFISIPERSTLSTHPLSHFFTLIHLLQFNFLSLRIIPLMSFTETIWQHLLPIATTLFMYSSCDSRKYCWDDQVEHDETDSVSTIASFYTPLPPPSLVPTQSIPLVTFSVYGESQRHNPESLQQSTRERLALLSLFPPFNLVFNEDIIGVVFALMDLPTLARCSTVCRVWYQFAVAELWRDALSTSMRPLLEFMDTYYLESCVDPVSCLSRP